VVRLQEYGHPVIRFEGGAEEPDWAAQSTAAIASVCVQGRPGVVPDPCFKERKKGRKPVMPRGTWKMGMPAFSVNARRGTTISRLVRFQGGCRRLTSKR
jgi:predicted pyridoxine 5'-phosphate oxidase superfamily flavin-nucleotide-binding protein